MSVIKISANSLLLYQECPAKWLYMKKGLKQNFHNLAFYRFSSTIHSAIKQYIEVDDKGGFAEYWDKYKKDKNLIYKEGESWESLRVLGIELMEKFYKIFTLDDLSLLFMEKNLKLKTDKWELSGRPDFAGMSGDDYVVIDWKVTQEPTEESWIRLSDQLIGYAMMLENEFQLSVGVDIVVYNFVKSTKEIYIHKSRVKPIDIKAYMDKIDYLVDLMNGTYHPKRPLYFFSSPCKWCNYVKICVEEGNVVKNPFDGVVNG